MNQPETSHSDTFYYSSDEERAGYLQMAYQDEQVADLLAAYKDLGSLAQAPELATLVWAVKTREQIGKAVNQRLQGTSNE